MYRLLSLARKTYHPRTEQIPVAEYRSQSRKDLILWCWQSTERFPQLFLLFFKKGISCSLQRLVGLQKLHSTQPELTAATTNVPQAVSVPTRLSPSSAICKLCLPHQSARNIQSHSDVSLPVWLPAVAGCSSRPSPEWESPGRTWTGRWCRRATGLSGPSRTRSS